MEIITTVKALKEYLALPDKHHLDVGFVPTMGALHKGHMSLIETSKNQCSITVCSIFVNPLQFNDPSDLKRYPRTPEKDKKMLEKAGCEVLFMPSIEEIYPEPAKETYYFGQLDQILEAAYRPGHFKGVAQVLSRFFNIIQAEKAFFGEKDYQQLLIVKDLVKQTGLSTQIVPCPIIRESDGLAMSSRNALLSENERALAGSIPKIMKKCADMASDFEIEAIKSMVSQEIALYPDFKLEYFEICDPSTLDSLSGKLNNRAGIALIAVYAGKIRLIDNIQIGQYTPS